MNDRTDFWKGTFGDEYHRRAPGNVQSNFVFFRRALGELIWDRKLGSVLELGCGTGANLRALRAHLPNAHLAGVEVNVEAIREATQISGSVKIHRGSLLEWKGEALYDLVFTKGVLIHIAPEDLAAAYRTLIESSRRYVLVAEYYNPRPMEVPYRGHAGRLWKRDFAGELMVDHGLELVDYGFVYHGDAQAPQDDLNWFLLKKPL